jgi:hypothetical protein
MRGGWRGGARLPARSVDTAPPASTNSPPPLSEEYDPAAKRLLGNFPQAFSHIALVNTAHNIARAEKSESVWLIVSTSYGPKAAEAPAPKPAKEKAQPLPKLGSSMPASQAYDRGGEGHGIAFCKTTPCKVGSGGIARNTIVVTYSVLRLANFVGRGSSEPDQRWICAADLSK